MRESLDRNNGRRDLEYQFYIRSLYGSDNASSRRRLIKNLRRAMESELTPRQMQIMKLYFLEGVKMHEIAEELGLNKSTVSRTLSRGKLRLQRCLKYGAAGLLEDNEEE
ncbi:MAG: sigma-70 family RNA polymerase sigma factor [Oscillospiraceae bacterium]|nr:sigma-70 family RNA polymerase sigma factor [Oscillospiraceae bacterium]